ncbi:MAG TPA: zinc dependent phospholipase C family protein [Gallionellaceae bacterium]
MSGGYVHITLVQEAIEEAIYRRPGLLHDDARRALGLWKKFCIVGAVSPDYPYLDITSSDSAAWADSMHKEHALELLRSGIAKLRGMENDNVRQKCMAWLFGFASHVATDGTIHPIVNIKVHGAYEQHKTEHRRCEMSQDVYAQRRLNLGAISYNRQISYNIINCSDGDNDHRMDPDVAQLWQDMLTSIYAGHPAPQIHDWHRAMRIMMSLAQSSTKLVPFMRHVAANAALVYPDDPDQQYIQDLSTPFAGKTMGFEEIYRKAFGNTLDLWGWMSLSLQNRPSVLDALASWSLDSGVDVNGRMTYWS